MPIKKNLGENEGIDAGTDPSETVSYVGQETDPGTPEEKSDAQRVLDGEMGTDDTEDEFFVAPNSVYQPDESGKVESEGSDDPDETESSDEGEETTDAKPDEKEKVAEQKKEPAKKKAAAPDPVQKRINKITRKRYEAERKAEKLAAELAEAQKKLKETETAKEKAELEGAKPQAEDYETDAEYYEALGRWGAKVEISESRTIEKAEETPKEDQEDPMDEVMSVGREIYDDFDEIVRNPDVPISQQMVEAAVDSEYAHDILYHLGSNPDDAKNIFKMKTPAAVTRAIGRIEALFDADEVVEHLPDQDSELPTNSKQPRPSKAPKPVKPVGNKGTATKSPDNMSLAEYYESRGYTRDGMPKRRVM